MKSIRLHSLIAVAIAAAMFCTFANANTPNIDAGSTLNQNEQELKAFKPVQKFQAPNTKSEVKPADDEQTVFINGFRFSGNQLLSDEVLSQAVATYTNRALGLKQLREVADVVMITYRQAGWTARAYLPKQEIEDGMVTIQVVEAVFGGASLTGDEPKRIEAKRLIEMAESNLGTGQPLNAKRLDRVLLLLDDLPGVSVAGHLVPGDQDGETNLVLAANDEALYSGNAAVDNQGSRASGSERLSVNLNINSPAHLGDLLGINTIRTQGSEYYRLSYSLPVGYEGWRIGVHASGLYYRVITSEFASLNAFGTATTQGLDFTYPLLRSQLQNISFSASYDDKQFHNTSGGTTTSYAIEAYNASVNASYVDSWAGGGVTNASVGITLGDNSADSRYNKLALTVSRLQSLNETLSVFAAISAQTTKSNLDSSEKMYLGGATGVRAYPASEAGGSQGNTLTLELRKNLENNLSLIGFYDYGHVKVNLDNSISSSANPNDYCLQGYGVSVAWKPSSAVDVKLTVAQRIGTNPAANSSTGMDGDGTKTETRIWFSTSIAF